MNKKANVILILIFIIVLMLGALALFIYYKPNAMPKTVENSTGNLFLSQICALNDSNSSQMIKAELEIAYQENGSYYFVSRFNTSEDYFNKVYVPKNKTLWVFVHDKAYYRDKRLVDYCITPTKIGQFNISQEGKLDYTGKLKLFISSSNGEIRGSFFCYKYSTSFNNVTILDINNHTFPVDNLAKSEVKDYFNCFELSQEHLKSAPVELDIYYDRLRITDFDNIEIYLGDKSRYYNVLDDQFHIFENNKDLAAENIIYQIKN